METTGSKQHPRMRELSLVSRLRARTMRDILPFHCDSSCQLQNMQYSWGWSAE